MGPDLLRLRIPLLPGCLPVARPQRKQQGLQLIPLLLVARRQPERGEVVVTAEARADARSVRDVHIAE